MREGDNPMTHSVFLPLLVLLLAIPCRAQPPGDRSLYNLDALWTDQNGAKIGISQFKGRPVVLAMVYTSCKGACPLIVEDIKNIERGLSPPQREHTQFALVSIDSDRDKPERLREFRKAHAIEAGNWTLLTGTKGSVRELAAAIGFRFRKDPGGSFSHSNLITILDREGVIRHQQEGLKQDPSASIREIVNLVQ
jgi:protein SCO1/2